jgi:hypothetical protein
MHPMCVGEKRIILIVEMSRNAEEERETFELKITTYQLEIELRKTLTVKNETVQRNLSALVYKIKFKCKTQVKKAN